MKTSTQFVTLLFIFLLAACSPKTVVPQKNVELETINNGGREILINEVDKEILQTEPYSVWFNQYYDSYEPKQDVIEELKRKINDYNLELFFGSWCGDSKRGVPQIYRILDLTEYNLNRLTTTAVGRKGALYKKSTDGATEGKNIKRVPTLIVYNLDGEEIGRIEENPIVTFEEDLLKIINDH